MGTTTSRRHTCLDCDCGTSCHTDKAGVAYFTGPAIGVLLAECGAFAGHRATESRLALGVQDFRGITCSAEWLQLGIRCTTQALDIVSRYRHGATDFAGVTIRTDFAGGVAHFGWESFEHHRLAMSDGAIRVGAANGRAAFGVGMTDLAFTACHKSIIARRKLFWRALQAIVQAERCEAFTNDSRRFANRLTDRRFRTIALILASRASRSNAGFGASVSFDWRRNALETLWTMSIFIACRHTLQCPLFAEAIGTITRDFLAWVARFTCFLGTGASGRTTLDKGVVDNFKSTNGFRSGARTIVITRRLGWYTCVGKLSTGQQDFSALGTTCVRAIAILRTRIDTHLEDRVTEVCLALTRELDVGITGIAYLLGLCVVDTRASKRHILLIDFGRTYRRVGAVAAFGTSGIGLGTGHRGSLGSRHRQWEGIAHLRTDTTIQQARLTGL